MSASQLIKMPEMAARLKPLRPALPRKIGAPLKVAPRTMNDYSLVGTAFDYLLRFEIERRAPYAKSRPWVAECVSDINASEIVVDARLCLAAHLNRKSPTNAETMELEIGRASCRERE